MKAIRWLACVLALATIGLVGLRSAAPAVAVNTLVVDDDGWGSASDCDSTTDVAFSTIQAAVSAAFAGDTILVCPGEYTEAGQIVISKNLSIVGAGASTTIIKPAGDTGSSGDAKGWFLVNDGITFNLSGVTLDGTGHKVWQAIRDYGQGSISDCAFTNIKFEESGPSYAGTAIVAFGTGGMNVDVTNCTFTGIGRVGVLYYGSGVTGSTFSGNTYTGKGTGNWLDYAVEVGAGAHATVTRNTISGNTGVASVDGSTSAGIIVTTYYDSGTQATITENFISGSTTGVGVGYDASDTSAVTVFNNSLTANTKGVESTAPPIDASGNWWGSNTPASVASQVSTNVDYTPWLDSGADTDAGTPGFQGAFSTLDVDDDSPQTGATGRIQEGINLVSGSTVNVAAGTYTEQLDIGKPLTLTGAGQASTIIKSPAALATKFVNNKPVVYIHDATGVTVQQLTVDGDGKGNANYRMLGIAFYKAGGAVDHVTITRVRETPLSGTQHGVALYTYNADGVTRTLNISNNTIEEYQKNGMALIGAGLAVTVTGNIVTGSGPTGVTAQNGIQVSGGATGTVGGNTVSNNSYTGGGWSATDVLVSSANVDITGNHLNNGMLGLYYIDGSGTISGNTVSATTLGVGRTDYWGIDLMDPPALSPSPFEEEAAPPAGGGAAAPMGAGVMTVVVSDNILTGDGSADSVGLEADAGWGGPKDVSFTASGNTISNWGTGVTVTQCDSGCSGAVFTSAVVGPNNNISGNDNGVFLGGASGVVIKGNEIHHNVNRPGYAGAGIMLWGDNDNNQILNNVVHDNDRQGIFVGHDTLISTGNTISGNTVYNNGRNTNPNPPDASAYGIQLQNADSNTISNNEIYGHDDWFYYPGFDFAQGIYLFDSNHNLLSGNYLHDNNYGVGLWGPGRGDGSNLINFNNISDNTGYGVRNFDTLMVNAENNWWGACSGPYHPTLNPLGTGNAASDYVDFDPWTHGACDYDGDTLSDDQEMLVIGTDWRNPDTDGDGCKDGREYAGMPSFSPLVWYDFYDVPVPANPDMTRNGPRNRAIDISDVLAVLFYSGTSENGRPNGNSVDYDSVKGSCDVNADTVPDKEGLCYDRTPSAPPNPPYEAGPPNGSIDISDVLTVLAQVGLDCSTP